MVMDEGMLRLAEHSQFFDHLVELIPPKVYLASEQQSTGSSKYIHNKSEKAKAKAEAKEHSKKARRTKLDPSSFKTTLDIQKEHQEKEQIAFLSKEYNAFKLPSGERAATHEQLRERLHQRLSALRAKRKADDASAAASQARDWQLKKRGGSASAPKRKSGESDGQVAIDQPKVALGAATGASTKESESKVEEVLDLQYGRLSLGQDGIKRPKKKPRTERLLAEAAALQEKLSAAKLSGDGEQVSTYTWNSAADRASGKKVLDDPKLLKRTLQKQEKARKKSTSQWEERKGREKASISAKQEKRKEHLNDRSEAKKKARVAKREKKLQRPGFEGRAKGVINKDEG